jgi:DNA-binding HxlR family transcriptional regulator
MRKKQKERRSECPLNASVEMLGDRWSLLIIRDMMLRGANTYKEFMECYEGIATNILGNRLRKPIAYGIIAPETSDTLRVTWFGADPAFQATQNHHTSL